MWPFRRRDPKEVKRTVGVFSVASFLHDIGADMIFSVWPLYLTQVLGASMAAVGFIDGLGDAIVSFSQAGAGFLSDRLRKRKVFVWAGYFFGCLARIGYALAPTWQWAVPFRVLDRSGKIRSAPRDAMISDISDRGNRATHFGILRTLDNLGAVLGILIAVALVGRITYRSLFLLAAIPSLLAALLVIRFVAEPAHRTTLRPTFRWRGLGGNLWLFMVLSAIFDLGAFSYSFLLLASHDAGIHVGSIPLLYLLFTLFAALVSLPAGKLADSIGRKPVVLLSYACWVAVAALFILRRDSVVAIIAAFVLYGFYRGGIDTVQKAFTAELAPPAFVASVLGGFQLILGAVSLPASLIAGILWERVSPTAPFVFALALAVIACVLLLFVQEGRGRSLPQTVAV
jgi:MFS family permease